MTAATGYERQLDVWMLGLWWKKTPYVVFSAFFTGVTMGWQG